MIRAIKSILAALIVSLAAAKGHKSAIKNRKIAAKKMTPAQIAEAQRLEWKVKK